MRNDPIRIRRLSLVTLPVMSSLVGGLMVSLMGCTGQMVDPSGLGPNLPSSTGGAGAASGSGLGGGGVVGVGSGSGGGAPSGAGGATTGAGTVGGGSGGGVGTAGGNAGGSPGPATGAGAAGALASTGGLPCDVQTLVVNRCQTCHGVVPAGGAPSTLVTYQNLTGPSRSDPTKTEAEMAVSRMQNPTLPMPPKPGTPATAAEVAVLEGWIAAGYPTGSCGGAPDGGVADGGGGVPTDPFAAAPVCTSQTTWTRGNSGSASMQPGAACINCHASGGEAPRFAVAGTVYPTAHEPDQCDGANGTTGVAVVITGSDGTSITLTPNAAGNFSSRGLVATPYQAKVTYMGRERAMVAAQTSGDCNACHTQTGASGAPGRILLP